MKETEARSGHLGNPLERNTDKPLLVHIKHTMYIYTLHLLYVCTCIHTDRLKEAREETRTRLGSEQQRSRNWDRDSKLEQPSQESQLTPICIPTSSFHQSLSSLQILIPISQTQIPNNNPNQQFSTGVKRYSKFRTIQSMSTTPFNLHFTSLFPCSNSNSNTLTHYNMYHIYVLHASHITYHIPISPSCAYHTSYSYSYSNAKCTYLLTTIQHQLSMSRLSFFLEGNSSHYKMNLHKTNHFI